MRVLRLAGDLGQRFGRIFLCVLARDDPERSTDGGSVAAGQRELLLFFSNHALSSAVDGS